MPYSIKLAGQAMSVVAHAMHRALASFNEDAARMAYLNGATDRIDLELRMRELDTARDPLAGYPTNFSFIEQAAPRSSLR